MKLKILLALLLVPLVAAHAQINGGSAVGGTLGGTVNGSLTVSGDLTITGGINFQSNQSYQGAAAIPIGTVLSYVDNFSVYTSSNVCLPDTFQLGPWTSVYNGYGCNKVLNGGTSSYFVMTSSPSYTPSETHAALVTGPLFTVPLDYSVTVKTTSQTRIGGGANFEVAWVPFMLRDSFHYYYFIPKPLGWELGKEDPAYAGNQRFMATGLTPSFPIGSTYTVRITMDVNNLITVYVNGALITTYRDTERPYQSGYIGFYLEDSRVEFSNVVVNATMTAVAPFVIPNDRFGLKEIYPTVSGGREWTSNWDLVPGHPISGVTTPSVDPQDPWGDYAHGNFNANTDGINALFITSGTVSPGVTPRIYIHDPSCPYSGQRGCAATPGQWRDVEVTVYGLLPSGHTLEDYEGISIAVRTKHGPDTDICDTRGYHLRVRYDGNVDVFKETSHPDGTVGNQIDNPGFVGTFPLDTWIGVKGIAYDLPNGNVKLEIWQDLTDGANGGTWTKIWEFTDNGGNLGGSTACKASQTGYEKLTSTGSRTDSESGYGNLSVYLRNTGKTGTGVIFKYKKFSIREITTVTPAAATVNGVEYHPTFVSALAGASFGVGANVSTFTATGAFTTTIGASTQTWSAGRNCVRVTTNTVNDAAHVFISSINVTSGSTALARIVLPPNVLTTESAKVSVICVQKFGAGNPAHSSQPSLSVCGNAAKVLPGSSSTAGPLRFEGEIGYLDAGHQTWGGKTFFDSDTKNASGTDLACDSTKPIDLTCNGKGVTTGDTVFQYFEVCY